MNTDTKLSIVIKEVKINFDDLAYLKGLEPGGTRCYGRDRIKNKLIFLGLIKLEDIPPCPKAIAAFERKIPDAIKAARAALRSKDWKALRAASQTLDYPGSKPTGRKDYALTASGKELLKRGSAQSTVAATKGCV